ncbi:MAG TPA: Holliday junction resolvase RuvX [Blastocatellia bacterium]|nr:Holliday junction resolvase RuvX [Blastocatellia bacterium]
MNSNDVTDSIRAPVLALDLGSKRVGVAVSDSLSISINRLAAIQRTNWKQLLRDVEKLALRLDAQTLVIGLPLKLDGSLGDAALAARQTASKFARSLRLPVYLQDERLSSAQAEQNLREAGVRAEDIGKQLDSEAAALILRDFLASDQERLLVSPHLSD